MEKTIQNKLKKYMKKRRYLIWYAKEPENLPVEAIVEHTLNYGNWDDFNQLIKIVGIKKIAEIFRRQTSGPRTNYDKKARNYFSLYFNKYAK
ncbi:MAG: hypothetical protein A2402_01315 [Candidatus Staskawiczbacteria bacterium RIFOXYC1_FULL_37_43]|nr:MAG: hypothetical protein A2813_02810 [Candidatus Staskawiczbacteria bacterium RIFCSPHIGHO2_01_FULL_37_17]OGZ71697.1 MAG: hypothetical protein A2891_00105 [Candidatus Staskawiczbacteria bacterium RIFCSPLOWO2_01_FULL_37_19]OGZ75391.1 MAG: hypothetical protein A2205_01455 [Candidatus Staskawiczbacteria bacterium RIFOXYA1_FULL_37_15]OGZ78000.1 MAG: hypothetical protein A2280_00225 [Candidatus Staskawiczbacteria bacterium RIFOXYA12_FULL_37_10]OGZ80842.1 MAG: hypothetical protein A2353_01220 [Can